MSPNLHFVLFQDYQDRAVWRGSFADLDTAMRNAQKLADEERLEFFVCDDGDLGEVARLLPS
jgi:hypothetical protein